VLKLKYRGLEIGKTKLQLPFKEPPNKI
jgi:hypothetical protein